MAPCCQNVEMRTVPGFPAVRLTLNQAPAEAPASSLMCRERIGETARFLFTCVTRRGVQAAKRGAGGKVITFAALVNDVFVQKFSSKEPREAPAARNAQAIADTFDAFDHHEDNHDERFHCPHDDQSFSLLVSRHLSVPCARQGLC
jgi:hypothetical protein